MNQPPSSADTDTLSQTLDELKNSGWVPRWFAFGNPVRDDKDQKINVILFKARGDNFTFKIQNTEETKATFAALLTERYKLTPAASNLQRLKEQISESLNQLIAETVRPWEVRITFDSPKFCDVIGGNTLPWITLKVLSRQDYANKEITLPLFSGIYRRYDYSQGKQQIRGSDLTFTCNNLKREANRLIRENARKLRKQEAEDYRQEQLKKPQTEEARRQQEQGGEYEAGTEWRKPRIMQKIALDKKNEEMLTLQRKETAARATEYLHELLGDEITPVMHTVSYQPDERCIQIGILDDEDRLHRHSLPLTKELGNAKNMAAALDKELISRKSQSLQPGAFEKDVKIITVKDPTYGLNGLYHRFAQSVRKELSARGLRLKGAGGDDTDHEKAGHTILNAFERFVDNKGTFWLSFPHNMRKAIMSTVTQLAIEKATNEREGKPHRHRMPLPRKTLPEENNRWTDFIDNQADLLSEKDFRL